jgi:hypothetical protein
MQLVVLLQSTPRCTRWAPAPSCATRPSLIVLGVVQLSAMLLGLRPPRPRDGLTPTVSRSA